MMSNTASNQKFSSWQHLVLEDDKIERHSKSTGDVVAISHCAQNTNQSMALDYLKDDLRGALSSAEKAAGSISLPHDAQEVSGGIGSSFESKTFVEGWGTSAVAL